MELSRHNTALSCEDTLKGTSTVICCLSTENDVVFDDEFIWELDDPTLVTNCSDTFFDQMDWLVSDIGSDSVKDDPSVFNPKKPMNPVKKHVIQSSPWLTSTVETSSQSLQQNFSTKSHPVAKAAVLCVKMNDSKIPNALGHAKSIPDSHTLADDEQMAKPHEISLVAVKSSQFQLPSILTEWTAENKNIEPHSSFLPQCGTSTGLSKENLHGAQVPMKTEALSCSQQVTDEAVIPREIHLNLQNSASSSSIFNAISLRTFQVPAIKNCNLQSIPPTNEKSYQINDVLFGRGGETNHHEGNKWYRTLVKTIRPVYNHPDRKKDEKTALARSIVDKVHQRSGRFLMRNPKTDKWVEVTTSRARLKVSQALRENMH